MRHSWFNMFVFKTFFNNCSLDSFYRDRFFIDAKRACRFTRRRTKPSGKFREIISRVEIIKRLFPMPMINKIIPLRNIIFNRASGISVTKRNTAIHASGSLNFGFLSSKNGIKFLEMFYAFFRFFFFKNRSFEFHKTGWFTHCVPRLKLFHCLKLFSQLLLFPFSLKLFCILLE